MSDKSQKTEKPTQKRLEKARKEGQFATSRDFVGALQFVLAVVILGSWAPDWFSDLQQVLRLEILCAFKRDLSIAAVSEIGWTAGKWVFAPLFTAGALLVALTLGTQLALTRCGFSMRRLAPKWSRIDPVGRLQGLPQQNLFATLQTAVTMVLCGLALYVIAHRDAEQLFLLPLQPLSGGLGLVYRSMLQLLWNVAGVFVAFGCLDLFRQLRKHASELRMSRQEIRDEFKESDGNPATRTRIRRLQRAARRRKMLHQVRKATAVIVNPTHYAVALRYDTGSASAPIVIAKGRDYLALRIRTLAETHGVPLVENPPLAQALFKSAPLNAEIPPHFYRAVAEVLAYVFQVLTPESRRERG
jgi:flagellar biosynthetic protein FlhB